MKNYEYIECISFVYDGDSKLLSYVSLGPEFNTVERVIDNLNTFEVHIINVDVIELIIS